MVWYNRVRIITYLALRIGWDRVVGTVVWCDVVYCVVVLDRIWWAGVWYCTGVYSTLTEMIRVT